MTRKSGGSRAADKSGTPLVGIAMGSDSDWPILKDAAEMLEFEVLGGVQEHLIEPIGDSQMPPFAGQGMCAGLRDAANLAWRLDLALGGRDHAALLAGYDLERIPQAAAVIGFGSSSSLASAYGLAVSGTMLITTLLTFFVVRFGWRLTFLAWRAVFAVRFGLAFAARSFRGAMKSL